LKYVIIAWLSIIIHIDSIIPQSSSTKIFHPLSNSFGISLEVGGSLPCTDYKISELDIIGRLSAEYFFTSRSIHAFGLRLFTGAGYINGEIFSNEPVYPPISDKYRTGLFLVGTGVVYSIKLGYTVPYISASAGHLTFDPGDKEGNKLPGNSFSLYDKSSLLYSAEFGIKFPFNNVWTLNLGLNYYFTDTDYLDDIKIGSKNDGFLSFFAGISFLLGKATDIDNDGIDDDVDFCLDTPEGEKVGELGCSINPKPSIDYIYNLSNDSFIANGIFTDGTLFCLQVNIFQQTNEARLLQQKIVAYGYHTFINNIVIGNSIWYSVRIGYFESLKDAKRFKEIFFRTTGIRLE